MHQGKRPRGKKRAKQVPRPAKTIEQRQEEYRRLKKGEKAPEKAPERQDDHEPDRDI